jgi:methylated-DNA-protein-cysteine methyltransferase related protein
MADRAREEAILALARTVPEGFVTTYGDLSPEAPRLAGTVLRECEDATVPWHRIVRADGSLAQGERQRRLLEAEGVPFADERVEMELAHLPREALLSGSAADPDRGG